MDLFAGTLREGKNIILIVLKKKKKTSQLQSEYA